MADVTVKYTKSGKQFAVMRVEDFTGSREMMVWGEEFEKFGRGIVKGSVLEVTAKVEQDSRTESLQLVAQSLRELTPSPANAGGGKVAAGRGAVSSGREVPAVVLQLDAERDGSAELASIRAIVERFPGKAPLELLIRSGGKVVRLRAGARHAIDPAEAALEALAPWL